MLYSSCRKGAWFFGPTFEEEKPSVNWMPRLLTVDQSRLFSGIVSEFSFIICQKTNPLQVYTMHHNSTDWKLTCKKNFQDWYTKHIFPSRESTSSYPGRETCFNVPPIPSFGGFRLLPVLQYEKIAVSTDILIKRGYKCVNGAYFNGLDQSYYLNWSKNWSSFSRNLYI